MTDYEMLMIVLTFLPLLIMASKKELKHMRTAGQLQLPAALGF